MGSINLRDAYLHVPISVPEIPQMGKEVLHLQFKALPFSLSSAPQIFTKIMAEALAPLLLQGISVIPYLDDLLFFALSRENCSQT